MNISIPHDVDLILQKLNNNGFEAYIVGGCVRDSLMNITPHDYDICTSASPDETEACFDGFKTLDVGKKHGTIGVVINGAVYEVTTFRIDGEYTDNRHPKEVIFTKRIIDDLSRRDFTINAMAYNEESGVLDYFGGRADIKNKLIRCVGKPAERFNEDALRILRGLRFVSRLGFDIEEETSNAIHRQKDLLQNIAAERIREELLGILTGEHAEKILLEYRDVIARIIPELEPCFDFEQRTPHHYLDVYGHIANSVGNIKPDPLLRLTMLLHDIGKPQACVTDKNGIRHFKGHPAISAAMAEIILKRLRFPNSFISDCIKLIEYHDVRFKGSKAALKRVMRKIGEENTERLLKIQRADILAQSDYRRDEKLSDYKTAEAHFSEIVKNNECYSLKQLKISGSDLIAMGITDGKKIGETLNDVLNKVINGELENNKSDIIKYINNLRNP